MAIATFDQLRGATPHGDSLRFDSIRKSLDDKNLFLSHQMSDLAPAKAAVNLLERHGASVYLDVEDASLQASSPNQIAARLRNAIRACRRLVVIVTDNTQTSRWIPWEMGIADQQFGDSRVALLPIKPQSYSAEDWTQQSYFNLYARIEPSGAGTSPTWLVKTLQGNWVPLTQWINDTRPTGVR